MRGGPREVDRDRDKVDKDKHKVEVGAREEVIERKRGARKRRDKKGVEGIGKKKGHKILGVIGKKKEHKTLGAIEKKRETLGETGKRARDVAIRKRKNYSYPEFYEKSGLIVQEASRRGNK